MAQGAIAQQKTFLEFLDAYGFSDFPVSGSTLVVFAAYLIMSGRLSNSRSVKQYLAAASTLHKMFGLKCDTPSTLSRALKKGLVLLSNTAFLWTVAYM